MSGLRRMLAHALCASLAAGLAFGQNPELTGELTPIIEHVRANPAGDAAWSIDLGGFREDTSKLPIGVFDSGIGGLTVMEAILSIDGFNNRTFQPGADGVPDFAGERFIYLGDQANMPYGNYPSSGREGYLRELILKDAIFLLGRHYPHRQGGAGEKLPVKAIVIACNTATAFGIQDIRAALAAWNLRVPVIGVVEAGARAVSEHLPIEGPKGVVAVLATVGTCSSMAYPKAIGRAAGMAGKVAPKVIQQGSAGLAGAVEGNPAYVTKGPVRNASSYLGPAVANAQAPLQDYLLPLYQFDPAGLIGDLTRPDGIRLNSTDNYSRFDVATLVENYRKSGGGLPISSVVLGCTHFPIVQSMIAAAFARVREFRNEHGEQPYLKLISKDLEFVNPAAFTARELFRELARQRLRRNKESSEPPVLLGAFLSVPNPECPGVRIGSDGSFDPGYKYGRETGRLDQEDVFYVPLAKAGLPFDSLSGLARALPLTWKQIDLPQ